jgi:carbonic anhydrase
MVNVCVKGKMQSPIDINTKKAIKCGALCDLMIYYRSSYCNMVNTGKNLVLDYDNGSYIVYNTQVFELSKISFSIPALHTIDRFTYPIEVHLYHRNPDTSEVLVLAVFLDVNDATSKSSMFLEFFGNQIPSNIGQQKKINAPDTWRIYDLLPEQKSFFSYKGSLTRSPCTENITWIVMENPSNCTNGFYETLRKFIGRDKRSIKRLNGRKIFYNVNTNAKNNRNYGDKFRCYTDKEFRNACSKLTSDKEILTAHHEHLLKIAQTVTLVILLILFILWLVQQDFFSKTAEKIKEFLGTKIFLKKVANTVKN